MFCRYSLNFAEKIQTFNTYGQQTHKSLTLHLCGAGQKYVQNASNSRVNVSKATSQQAFKIYINNTAKVDPPQKKKKQNVWQVNVAQTSSRSTGEHNTTGPLICDACAAFHFGFQIKFPCPPPQSSAAQENYTWESMSPQADWKG